MLSDIERRAVVDNLDNQARPRLVFPACGLNMVANVDVMWPLGSGDGKVAGNPSVRH
jgi:hypothetical protein